MFLRISICLTGLVLLGIQVTCYSPYDKPVYGFLPPIALQYFKCTKCTSYDGGIYGKGPLKHYRTIDAKKCIHQWQETSMSDFAIGVNKDFNIDWSKDPMPYWQQLDEYTGAHQSRDATPAPPPMDEARQKQISERWKREHKIEDFEWLKDNYIKPGDTKEFVKEILGEPLDHPHTTKGTEYWLYVKCDDLKRQWYAWTLTFDSSGKVIEWIKKGIE